MSTQNNIIDRIGNMTEEEEANNVVCVKDDAEIPINNNSEVSGDELELLRKLEEANRSELLCTQNFYSADALHLIMKGNSYFVLMYLCQYYCYSVSTPV